MPQKSKSKSKSTSKSKKINLNKNRNLKSVKPRNRSENNFNLSDISKSLRSAKQSFTKGLLTLAKVKDWQKLGYESLKDFIGREHPELEYHTVLATLNAAITEQRLFGKDSYGQYSMNAMRVLKDLDDSQVKEFLRLAQDKWKKEGNSESCISPKWLTRTNAEKLKASLFKKYDKTELESSGTKNITSTKKESTVKKDFDKSARKLTRALSNYNGDISFLQFLMNFLATEFSSSLGEELLTEVKRELKRAIDSVRSNGKATIKKEA